MLCHYIASHIKKLLGSRFFLIRIVPAIRDNNIDFGVRIDRFHADGKCVDASGYFGVGRILSCDIANLITFGIHSGNNTT